MSAYSDWKCGAISREEYESIMREEDARDRYYEYSLEQADIPFEPTCECCEFCKRGLKFCYDIVDIFTGQPPKKDTVGTNCVLKKDLHSQGYMDICVRDIEHIKEINTFDPVCEDHGELYYEEDF